MKKIVVGGNDAGQRTDKFLTKLLYGVPAGMIYKWLRKKRVKVNGKRADGAYRLADGDVLELYINDEFFAENEKRRAALPAYLLEGRELRVVYEDGNILVADKPSGLSAHSPFGTDGDCLIYRIQAYLYQKGEFDPRTENTFSPALCNRIDRNTSGLVIAAKNAAALRGINEKIRNREIEKYYILRTEGVMSPRSGTLEGYILKDEKTHSVKFFKNEVKGAKRAATEYRVLDDGGLTEVRLLTGRTHQIRASFAAAGHPLCGDVRYGAQKNGGKDFQDLRAYKIVFSFKTPSAELGYLDGKAIETEKHI